MGCILSLESVGIEQELMGMQSEIHFIGSEIGTQGCILRFIGRE